MYSSLALTTCFICINWGFLSNCVYLIKNGRKAGLLLLQSFHLVRRKNLHGKKFKVTTLHMPITLKQTLFWREFKFSQKGLLLSSWFPNTRSKAHTLLTLEGLKQLFRSSDRAKVLLWNRVSWTNVYACVCFAHLL